MPAYVVLLRAINVGGRYYRMAALRDHLTESGPTEVETYIQSGNVRLRSTMRSPARVEAHVEAVLARHCGFDVPAVVLTPGELRQVHDDVARAPVPDAGAGEVRRFVAVFKPGQAPVGDVARRIAEWDAPGETAVVLGRAVHVAVAGTMHEARFFAAFKKPLAAGTVRNADVVGALAGRWGAADGPQR